MGRDKMTIQEKDMADLRAAKALLESPSLAVKMGNLFGKGALKIFRMMPASYKKIIAMSTIVSIEKSWQFTLTTMAGKPEPDKTHTLYATISGAVGGVGILTLFVELPITTIIMLRSIADIAKSEGEDYGSLETKIACLEVFALGGETVDEKTGKTGGYYAIRSTLDRPLRVSSKYIAQKGVAGMGAPFVVQLVAKIAARYQTAVSVRVAAKAVPVAGAIGGAAINIVFIRHFQDKARGHFIIRRLEREYGYARIRSLYEEIDADALTKK